MTPDAVPGYSSPKQGTLLVLKRDPGASLEEVARSLGISKAAALGHLTRLESDGLVSRRYVAGKVGRPRVTFELTDAAHGLFPQGYSEMSLCALAYVRRRLGAAAVSELLAERAHEFADRHRREVAAGPMAARVEQLARIRTQAGYMAEVGARKRRSVEMREHNCPVLAIAEQYPEACETERRMFESLLSARVDATHRVVAGDPVCRFLIRERGAPP